MNKSIKNISAILILLCAASFTASAAVLEAKVVSAKGKTEVQKGSDWEALQIGSILHRGDVIQTGFKSELIIMIKNTTVKVSPMSRVTIEQLAEKGDKDETRLFLDTGSLKSDVKKTQDRRVGFTVRSPVATASVRGTELEVKNVVGGTEIIGYEGSTAAWSSKAPQQAAVAEDDEEAPAVTGNGPEAVSDGQAEAGAVLVKKNMKFSGTATGSVTPKENAAKASSDIGGTKEIVTVEAPAPEKTSKAATVTIRVSVKD